MKLRLFFVGALVLLLLLALFAWMASKPAKLMGVEVPVSMIPPPLVARLAHTNAQIRIFPGVTGTFIVLPDGTLWSWGLRLSSGRQAPVQVGNRTDWSFVCGAGTAFGGTSDGTLWMWGSDMSQQPIPDKPAPYRLIEDRVLAWFGLGGRAASTSAQSPYQREPRPVLKWMAGAPETP